MDISITEPAVSLYLTVDEATALYRDLEDVYESSTGPGLQSATLRLMNNLGATLEESGYLPDDDPDPEPVGNVINMTVAPHRGPSLSPVAMAMAFPNWEHRAKRPERDCA